jgi:hypothetical protein
MDSILFGFTWSLWRNFDCILFFLYRCSWNICCNISNIMMFLSVTIFSVSFGYVWIALEMPSFYSEWDAICQWQHERHYLRLYLLLGSKEIYSPAWFFKAILHISYFYIMTNNCCSLNVHFTERWKRMGGGRSLIRYT